MVRYSKYTILLLFVALFAASCKDKTKPATTDSDSTRLVPLEFCADSAMKFIDAQCGFGARTPGSAAHEQCAAYIADAFRAYGLTITEQRMTLQGWDGKTFPCVNITAAYKPELQNRVVIASPWESRPWADNGPDSALSRTAATGASAAAIGHKTFHRATVPATESSSTWSEVLIPSLATNTIRVSMPATS